MAQLLPLIETNLLIGKPMNSELDFRSSSGLTVGAELELQIIDLDTNDLAPGALRILRACEEERVPGVSGEFLLCMIEVKSDVCRNVAGLRDNLFPRLAQVRNIA